MAKLTDRNESTVPQQWVIHDDQTKFADDAAYYVSVPTRVRNPGIYAGVYTVEDHEKLIEHFTDPHVFADEELPA